MIDRKQSWSLIRRIYNLSLEEYANALGIQNHPGHDHVEKYLLLRKDFIQGFALLSEPEQEKLWAFAESREKRTSVAMTVKRGKSLLKRMGLGVFFLGVLACGKAPDPISVDFQHCTAAQPPEGVDGAWAFVGTCCPDSDASCKCTTTNTQGSIEVSCSK